MASHYHTHGPRYQLPPQEMAQPMRATYAVSNNWTTILVCGANGNVGKATTESLLQMANNWQLRVKVGIRTRDRLHEWHQKGAEPVLMDFSDYDSLLAAMRDVDRVWITLPNPESDSHPFDRSRLAMNVIDAAQAAGVKFVLLGSVPFADTEKALFHKEFLLVEKHLHNSGLNHAIIRMNVFMENAALLKRALHGGQLPFPLGNASFSPISVMDIGLAAATILANPARYTHEIFTLTGPEAVTGVQMATAASRIFGKPVSYVNAPPRAIYQTFGKAGMPEWQIGGLLELFDLFRLGIATQPTGDFQHITNKRGTTFEQGLLRLKYLGAI